MMQPTFCNPLPLPDVASCLPFSGKCRACAEACMLDVDGVYYLYPSHNGVYTSRDFVTWEAHEMEFLPNRFATPDAGPHNVTRAGNRYLLTTNNVTEGNTASPLYESNSPAGPWRALGEMTLPDGRRLRDLTGPLNVMNFYDSKLLYDNGRLYAFWGCSPDGGIWGAELDAANPVQMLTEPKLLFQYQREHVWERHGANHENPLKAWVEGCFPFQHNGTYYLLYCAAGVQYPSYSTGYYTAKSPLGPYTYAEENPIANAPHGMAPGGGHASLFADRFGHYWFLYTVVYAGSYQFERLTAVEPAWFDNAGKLHVTCGTDVPQFVPGAVAAPQDSNTAGLMRINLLKTCTASSSAPGCMPLLAAEGSPRSWWQPAAEDDKPIWEEDLNGKFPISALRIVWKEPNYDAKAGIVSKRPVRYVVEYAAMPPAQVQIVVGTSDEEPEAKWQTLVDASTETRDLWVDYRTFPEVVAAKVRIRILDWTPEVGIGIVDAAFFGKECVSL